MRNRAVIAALISIVLVVPSSQAAQVAACGTKWSKASSPNASATEDNVLSGVDARTADDAWAVGYSGDKALILRWNGTKWSITSHPDKAGRADVLNGVSTAGAAAAWAVGTHFDEGPSFDGRSLILRWNGTKWTAEKAPNPSTLLNNLNAVEALSPTNVWAVGETRNDATAEEETFILHRTASGWNRVDSPSTFYDTSLEDVDFVAKDDGWAVGDAQILHWDGKEWTAVQHPVANGDGYREIQGVLAISSSDVWAVGEINKDGFRPLVMHWNGTKWSVVASANPSDGGVFDAAANSKNDLWAVGPGTILHSTGGQWTGQKGPLSLLDVDGAGGRMWAVGANFGQSPYRTLIFQRCT